MAKLDNTKIRISKILMLEKLYSISDKEREIVRTSFNLSPVDLNNIKLKYIISGLSVTNRRIIILYADLKSQTKVAKLFKCSRTPIQKRIKGIQRFIKKEMKLDIEEIIKKYDNN